MFDKDRFEAIMSEIAELTDEALHMVPPAGRERAKCYWYAHIKGAIGGQYGSEFLGGSMRSMTDELEAYSEPDEDDEEDEG